MAETESRAQMGNKVIGEKIEKWENKRNPGVAKQFSDLHMSMKFVANSAADM